MNRAVGYCAQEECQTFVEGSGTFLLDMREFYCARCSFKGWIEPERRYDHAPADAIEPIIYKTVKVYFNFDPKARHYNNAAAVSIPEMGWGYSYEIYNPLIRTEKRALMVGESALCALNSGDRSGEPRELTMNFADGNWADQIKKLEAVLSDRDRRVYNVRR